MTITATVRIAVLASVLTYGSVIDAEAQTTAAQGPQGPMTDVLHALTDLGRAVSTLQASVDQVQRTLDAMAEPHGNVLYTPSLTFTSGTVFCSATNVTDTFKKVRVELFTGDSTLTGGTAIIGPGKRLAFGAIEAQVNVGDARCEFEVIDGAKDDIRASLYVVDLQSNPTVTLLAQ